MGFHFVPEIGDDVTQLLCPSAHKLVTALEDEPLLVSMDDAGRGHRKGDDVSTVDMPCKPNVASAQPEGGGGVPSEHIGDTPLSALAWRLQRSINL